MNENKRCILIADDEPKMVRALRDFFKASGFCVLEARDGIRISCNSTLMSFKYKEVVIFGAEHTVKTLA